MANRIRELREDRDLRQIDVARATGIDQKTLSNYETGKTNPDSTAILRLADFFDVTTDYLLGRSNYNLNNTKKLISALHEIALDLDDICNQLKQELFFRLPLFTYGFVIACYSLTIFYDIFMHLQAVHRSFGFADTSQLQSCIFNFTYSRFIFLPCFRRPHLRRCPLQHIRPSKRVLNVSQLQLKKPAGIPLQAAHAVLKAASRRQKFRTVQTLLCCAHDSEKS